MEVAGPLGTPLGLAQRKRASPRGKKAKWLSGEALQIAVKRIEAKSKGEKERYKHLNAEFQRIARRGEKAFLNDQCTEIEENNRMGKTRDVFSPTGCLSPARGLGCTHCASGPVSGWASYVCTRFWEPVCLRFFGCTPVPQAARPLARMPGWAHLSRAAREVDCGRCPACITGPAPTCLGSGQGACREPRGTLAGWARRCWGCCPAGWARRCWGGCPAGWARHCWRGLPCRVGSALLGGGACRPSRGHTTVVPALGRAFLSCPD